MTISTATHFPLYNIEEVINCSINKLLPPRKNVNILSADFLITEKLNYGVPKKTRLYLILEWTLYHTGNKEYLDLWEYIQDILKKQAFPESQNYKWNDDCVIKHGIENYQRILL